MSIKFYYNSIFTYLAYLKIDCKIILAISEAGDGQEKGRGRIRSSRASAISGWAVRHEQSTASSAGGRIRRCSRELTGNRPCARAKTTLGRMHLSDTHDGARWTARTSRRQNKASVRTVPNTTFMGAGVTAVVGENQAPESSGGSEKRAVGCG